MDHHRHVGINTDGFTRLARLPRHGNGGQQEDQAVDTPADVKGDNHRVHPEVVMTHGTNNTGDNPCRQQHGNDQVRANDTEIEIAHVQQRAFIGYVELAAFREDQGNYRRQHQVEGQHQVVDLPPEAVAETPVDPRVHINTEEQVRQHIGENQARRGVNNVQVEQQISQRRSQERHARQRKLEREHGVQIAKTLLPLQATAKQRVIDTQNLRHAARPAGTLNDVYHQTLGGQPCRQRDIEIGRLPTQTLHLQRGVGIFGYGFYRKAANLF